MSDPRFDEHMKWLGHVSAIWASLELSVNMAIWELANVERWIGACLTTQIFSPSARFRALISLVHVRGGQPEIISKIHKFAEGAGGLSRRRNSYVHDSWALDETTCEVKRIHVTMEGAFSFGFTPTSVDELKRLFDDIQDGIRRFDQLRDEIFRSLPPWPRTQFSRSRGIRSYPLDQSSGQTRASTPALIISGVSKISMGLFSFMLSLSLRGRSGVVLRTRIASVVVQWHRLRAGHFCFGVRNRTPRWARHSRKSTISSSTQCTVAKFVSPGLAQPR